MNYLPLDFNRLSPLISNSFFFSANWFFVHFFSDWFNVHCLLTVIFLLFSWSDTFSSKGIESSMKDISIILYCQQYCQQLLSTMHVSNDRLLYPIFLLVFFKCGWVYGLLCIIVSFFPDMEILFIFSLQR